MFGFTFKYPDMDSAFSIDKTLDVFSDRDLKLSKKEKYLDKILNSKNFYGYIFTIGDNDGAKKEKLKKLYKIMTDVSNLDVIIAALEDFRIDNYPRSAATFIYTICNYVTSECNINAAKIDADFKDGIIRRSEKEDRLEDVEEKFARVKQINNRYINDMIKPYAKKLYRKSGVPKDICMTIVKNMPEKIYISKDQIGSYMNIVTDAIYTGIDDCDDVDHIDWAPFFKSLFGEEYTKDVAMYLTVEGANRIKRTWKNESRVQYIWDSLTAYALDTLEELSSDKINQVVGLYKKVVASMSGDEKNALRVDLTKLDENLFPNICQSVKKCYSSIKDAVNIAKGKKDRFKSDDDLPTVN